MLVYKYEKFSWEKKKLYFFIRVFYSRGLAQLARQNLTEQLSLLNNEHDPSCCGQINPRDIYNNQKIFHTT